MCGIAGFVEDERHNIDDIADPTQVVRTMCDVIRHRGPDDEGIVVGEGAALGMRRLSIIDLAGGHQPIGNEDGSIQVVFNGEIYNYRELRSELIGAGHRFTTDSDTEVIVHGYEQWGENVFSHLRGMFGIALWERPSRTLLLARDRIGIKPLHYAIESDRLIFGSEIKSILAASRRPRVLDPDALAHYLGFLYTPADTSIFTGIRKLAPGHYLRWQRGQATIRRYWQLPAEESPGGSLDDAAASLESILRDAVTSHLVSDVPIGALLSGGIDSSLVVALMARATSRVKTFSIGFDEPEFDELDGARRLAQHFSTDHHELVVRPDALDVVGRLVEHFDEPFGDSSAVPTWYVCQMARRHVTVVLSGDGGDELFGGYDRYLPHPRVARFDSMSGRVGRLTARAIWPLLPHGMKGKNFLRHVAQEPQGRYLDSIRFFQDDELEALLSRDVRQALHTDQLSVSEKFDRVASLSWPSQMMRVDLETYLPEDILTKVDRMSMAHSIESRVPLLDHEVVTFAASLPSDLKILGSERKRVLKRTAARILPAEVLTRKKRGFALPIGEWFRGPLRQLLQDTLQSSRARQRGYFQPRFVDRLVREHLTERRDHTLRLWQLLMFELWHRRYLDVSASTSGKESSLPHDSSAFPESGNLAAVSHDAGARSAQM
jgi:asparagine synthase (glutamine-hydrolysing)